MRGLAVVVLLLARLMLDTCRPHLDQTHWVWVIQGWAHIAGHRGHVVYGLAVVIAGF